MAALTFTIANLYDPKPGKKTGTIKTTSGGWISYWPSDKHLFAEGGTYKAVCDAREWEGKTYYTIKSPGKGGGIDQMDGGAPQDHPQAPLPAVSQPAGMSKDETITRLAIAKSCIEAGQSQHDADSWLAWVEKKPAPDAPVDAGGPNPPADEGLNDEIPF